MWRAPRASLLALFCLLHAAGEPAHSCARLPPVTHFTSSAVLFNSLRDKARAAPGAPEHVPVCRPLPCDVGPYAPCSVAWDNVTTHPCGVRTKGWELDFSDIVLGLSVYSERSFLAFMRNQLPQEPGTDALFDVPGVYFNSTAFRRVKLFVLDQCAVAEGGGGATACADKASASRAAEDVRALQARGIDARHETFVHSLKRANRTGISPIQTEKTYELFRRMRAWHPGAHFYLKMDVDTTVYPDLLLSFLRALEAAVGTSQPVYLGNTIMQYMQGSFYGLNGLGAELLTALPHSVWLSGSKPAGLISKTRRWANWRGLPT